MRKRTKLMLYRDEIETTKPGDLCDSYVVGKLKASFCGVRIPLRIALWWYGMDPKDVR